MTRPPETGETPEFSRPIATAKLFAAPATYSILASETERAALAKRFGLVALDRLTAEVRLRRAGGDVRLEADLSADLIQFCVVTLEPVPASVAESFALCYRPGIDEADAEVMAAANPEDELVEPLTGEWIDIGEAIAQQLAVAMDPYPRALSAQISDLDSAIEDAADTPDARPGPFDGLAAVKRPL